RKNAPTCAAGTRGSRRGRAQRPRRQAGAKVTQYHIWYDAMLIWRVEFFNAVAKAGLDQVPLDIRAKFARILEFIQAKGLEEVREPYVKHLEDKLWEMRMSGRDGIARSIYVAASGKRIVILHTFVKKTDRTPSSALAIARARAKEVK